VRGEWYLGMHDQDLLNQLIEFLRQVNFSTTKDDWCWRPDPGGVFYVKSAYLVLEKRDRPQRILLGGCWLGLLIPCVCFVGRWRSRSTISLFPVNIFHRFGITFLGG
jgi:hypothetical protein